MSDNLTTSSLAELFARDLNRLKKEISSYSDETNLWKTDRGITNSAGNLSLHLAGNLQHFIGAILGNSGYVRKRETEFSDTNIPREQLLEEMNQAMTAIAATLPSLTTDSLEAIYPLQVFGKPMTTLHFLIHLQGHLNYHLGQINYHRRLID